MKATYWDTKLLYWQTFKKPWLPSPMMSPRSGFLYLSSLPTMSILSQNLPFQYPKKEDINIYKYMVLLSHWIVKTAASFQQPLKISWEALWFNNLIAYAQSWIHYLSPRGWNVSTVLAHKPWSVREVHFLETTWTHK